MKKNKKLYFAALNKNTNKLLVATSKTKIAAFIGVHEATIRRWFDSTSCYITDDYIVWKNIPIQKIERNNSAVPPKSGNYREYDY